MKADFESFESRSGAIAIIGTEDLNDIQQVLTDRLGDSAPSVAEGDVTVAWARRVEALDSVIVDWCSPWETGAEPITVWIPRSGL